MAWAGGRRTTFRMAPKTPSAAAVVDRAQAMTVSRQGSSTKYYGRR